MELWTYFLFALICLLSLARERSVCFNVLVLVPAFLLATVVIIANGTAIR